ncbi:MAG TPA: hypothetical protein VER08_07835 [Pyrinomonadaceae bacterium]|nr:hypothetical protein [Pyrinomonadaceae bacterium]
MKDQNDFFDDVIDDEVIGDEPFSDEPTFMEFGDDPAGRDDDEEEEPTDMRTAVLTKNGMVALLSLKTTATGGQIVRVDPRQPLPTAQSYDDEASAERWFRRSLATSRRNGWQVAYEGEPLFG